MRAGRGGQGISESSVIVQEMALDESASDSEVELIVKRSSDLNAKDLRLRLPSASTLAELKGKMKEEYHDHPDPSCITVTIFISLDA